MEDISCLLEDACRKRYFNEQDFGNFTAMTPGLVDVSIRRIRYNILLKQYLNIYFK
jgi:hypothetical protein